MNVPALRSEIANMIREEMKMETPFTKKKAKKLDPKDINPVFVRVKNKVPLSNWLMRYYFNPTRKNEPWFNKKVTTENVLAYVSQTESNFPLSPTEIVDDWNIKQSLKGEMSKMRDLDPESMDDEEKIDPVYNTGDVTLKTIGKELGGLTAAMINKLEQSGMEKFAKTMAGRNPMDMTEEELDELLKDVEKARMETSLEFAKDLKAANGNIKGFLKGLVKQQILTPNDLKLTGQSEIEMLMFLTTKPVEQIAEYLRGDIKKDDNRIKSFQAAVARKVNPAGKRGRPKKVANVPG